MHYGGFIHNKAGCKLGLGYKLLRMHEWGKYVVGMVAARLQRSLYKRVLKDPLTYPCFESLLAEVWELLHLQEFEG